jgi:ribose 1,5-bisphosphate isomerase
VSLARQLAGSGIRVRLVTDSMLGLETVGAAAVLFGADTVYPAGDVINKSGTRLLALAAREDRVPAWCCTETSKIIPIPGAIFGPAVPAQKKRPSTEIFPGQISGVEIRNLYFDRTEAHLVSGFLTERGFLAPADISGLADELSGRYLRIFHPKNQPGA